MGVGYDKVDVAAATRHGVAICMGFGTNHQAVADHAFALMAGLANRRSVPSGGDGGPLGRPFPAGAVAHHGRHHRPRPDRPGARPALPGLRHARHRLRRGAGCGLCEEHGIELVDLATLFREADFVSVNAPLTPATEKIVNREHLALMKPSAFLINTARGGLVDEAALYEALAAGRIAGAGLDVFEVEPLPAGSPLRQLPNVLLTPHCAGGSIEAVVAMTNRCVDNLLAIRDGQPLGEDLLNPEARAG